MIFRKFEWIGMWKEVRFLLVSKEFFGEGVLGKESEVMVVVL